MFKMAIIFSHNFDTIRQLSFTDKAWGLLRGSTKSTHHIPRYVRTHLVKQPERGIYAEKVGSHYRLL
jgi:hypothetical protein